MAVRAQRSNRGSPHERHRDESVARPVGEGGEGGSIRHALVTLPAPLSQRLTPAGLLAIALLLSAVLVSVVTVALGS
jgi:hypothetical protein